MKFPSLALAALVAAAGSVHAADLRVACDQLHVSDASMSARYSHTAQRATFDVSFKAPAWAAPMLRPELEVRVDGRWVGTLPLGEKADGSLGGSLSFDSYANDGLAGPPVAAFPASWPGMLPPRSPVAGIPTRIQAGPLGCTLSG